MVVRERRKKRKTSRKTRYNTRRQNPVRKQQSKRQTKRRRKTNKLNRKRGKRSYKKYSRQRLIQDGGMEMIKKALNRKVHPEIEPEPEPEPEPEIETSPLEPSTQSTPGVSSPGCLSNMCCFRRNRDDTYLEQGPDDELEDTIDADDQKAAVIALLMAHMHRPASVARSDETLRLELDSLSLEELKKRLKKERKRLKKQEKETDQLFEDVNTLPLKPHPIPLKKASDPTTRPPHYKGTVGSHGVPRPQPDEIMLTFNGRDRKKHGWSPGFPLGFTVEHINLNSNEVLKVVEVNQSGPLSRMLAHTLPQRSLLPGQIENGHYFYFLNKVQKTPLQGTATVEDVNGMMRLLTSGANGGLQLEFVKHEVHTPPQATVSRRPRSAPAREGTSVISSL